jgi:hypothetical protein
LIDFCIASGNSVLVCNIQPFNKNDKRELTTIFSVTIRTSWTASQRLNGQLGVRRVILIVIVTTIYTYWRTKSVPTPRTASCTWILVKHFQVTWLTTDFTGDEHTESGSNEGTQTSPPQTRIIKLRSRRTIMYGFDI